MGEVKEEMFTEEFDFGSFLGQTDRESKQKIDQLARDIVLVIQNAAELRGKLTCEEVLAALHAVIDEVKDVGVAAGTEVWNAFVQEQASKCRSRRCRFGDEFHLPKMDSPDCQACFELWELTR
jgi:hypothetical protein